MNMTMYNLIIERLRPLVGLKGWDYCVLWKLSEDQRFIEWIGCCCSGIDEDTQNGGQELLFPVYQVFQCRDTMQHSRTNSCDILSHLPSSMPLDSGIYAKTMMSNQPCWLNCSSGNRDSSAMLERDGTLLLVPTAGGLMIELFVSKDVSENQQVIDFITAQCNIWREQDTLISASNTCSTNTPVLSPSMASLDPHDANLPYDITVDRIRLCSSESPSPLNFLQHVTSYNSDNRMKNSTSECNYDQGNSHEHSLDQPLENMEQQGTLDYQDSIKPADHSVSDCSDQTDDTNYKTRNGKEPQSKNLVAERKRRKKLNEKLYKLRSLVPNISKMDKASILKDAIDFVKDLQRQVKELQDVLEHNSNEDGGAKRTFNSISGNHNNYQSEGLNQHGISMANKPKSDNPQNGFRDSDHNTNEKGQQQMEPQVGVTQLDGNEFFVTVFCEQKPEGFVRLMEALDSLGLEVTNANVTSFRSLVSNVFKVEKRDSEILQADEVRDSLLEITRNPSKGYWPEMAKASGNDGALDYDHDKHHYHHHLHNYHSPPYHVRHLYN
ncbi:putative transcription factor bHLH family [Rosa chinensis]|uniref:Putative transcription factor bHLH family n=1 Tax=Rosa chinensis TaxID=74649 RepID=A0A2P6PSS1_ROSCH|nr:transcription factor ABORTED MICROSPORES [Rosa chinensis]PRQ24977.1 putative transcription factor bHLH family [Rosa chinensis]